MVILISSNSCWNLYNFRKDLISTLNTNNNQIIIVAANDNYKNKIVSDGVIFFPLHIKKNKKSILSDFICLLQYIYVNLKYKPNYSLAFTIKPNIYCSIAVLFTKTKMINNITGLGSSIIKDNFFSKIIFLVYKITLRGSYKVIFQNNEDKNLFINKNITNKNNSVLIPGSGIDMNKFNNKINLHSEIFRFIFIGRLIRDKGILEFIEAAEIVQRQTKKKVEFLVVGAYDNENPNKVNYNYFKKFVNKGVIKYLGFEDNPLPIIDKCNCVVLPSYREGLSRSLLESMALGKPIITSNVPGCEELVRNNSNGFLCKVKNKEDLAAKMFAILDLKNDEIYKMGKKAKKIIKEEYTNEIVIKKFLKLLDL